MTCRLRTVRLIGLERCLQSQTKYLYTDKFVVVHLLTFKFNFNYGTLSTTKNQTAKRLVHKTHTILLSTDVRFRNRQLSCSIHFATEKYVQIRIKRRMFFVSLDNFKQ